MRNVKPCLRSVAATMLARYAVENDLTVAALARLLDISPVHCGNLLVRWTVPSLALAVNILNTTYSSVEPPGIRPEWWTISYTWDERYVYDKRHDCMVSVDINGCPVGDGQP